MSESRSSLGAGSQRSSQQRREEGWRVSERLVVVLEEEREVWEDDRIPVTVVCGFLGAGKTTLVNHVIRSTERRCAVIENEFGEISVDEDLIDATRAVVECVEGCACCSGFGRLNRALKGLGDDVDTVLVEASGLSSPIAIARVLCVDRELRRRFRVDSVATVIDAEHFVPETQIDQILLADRIIVNKTDLVDESRLADIEKLVAGLNTSARVARAVRSRVDPAFVVGTHSFSVHRVLEEVDPEFLDDGPCHDPTAPLRPRWHDPTLSAVSISFVGAVNVTLLHAWLNQLLDLLPHDDLLRYKGVLNVKGMPNKFVLQGLRDRFDGAFHPDATWDDAHPRECKFAFIGRYLNKERLTRGFMSWTDRPVAVVA